MIAITKLYKAREWAANYPETKFPNDVMNYGQDAQWIIASGGDSVSCECFYTDRCIRFTHTMLDGTKIHREFIIMGKYHKKSVGRLARVLANQARCESTYLPRYDGSERDNETDEILRQSKI